MQVLVFAVVLIVIIAFIIYKVNNKFGTKEIVILVFLILIGISATIFLLKKSENTVPELFKEKYQTSRNIEILKLSATRLNNKNVSSKKDFIYDFDYIVIKNNKEYLCTSKNVKIKKIEDEYIFENFDTLNEKCISK